MQFQEGLEDSPFKRIRIAQTSFCSEVPNLSFLPQDGIEKFLKLGFPLTAKSGWPFDSFLNFAVETTFRTSISS